MDMKLRIFPLLAALFMVGCHSDNIGFSSQSYNTNSAYTSDNSVRKAQTRIAEAAVSVSDSLNQLAAIEKVKAPKSKLAPPPDPDRIGLGALASIDWTGPVEPLVLRLADAGHYRFRVVGRRPGIPVLVAVYAENMPIADILRDTNLQAGDKADIVIYPSRRTIELRYRNDR